MVAMVAMVFRANGMRGPSFRGGNWINYLDDRRIQRSRATTVWQIPGREWSKSRNMDSTSSSDGSTGSVSGGQTLASFGILTDSALAAQFSQRVNGAMPTILCHARVYHAMPCTATMPCTAYLDTRT